MGFLNSMKGVFSTGQASASDEAKRLYEAGDIAGAVRRLKDALDSRQVTGKSLAVIRERHDAYLEELHQRRLTEHRATLKSIPFDTSNYSIIERILSSIDTGLKEGIYSGKTRPEAEGLYKEYQVRFQGLREKAQKEKHQEIIGRLKEMDPEDNADEFVTLVEELRSIGGRLPQAMHSDYGVAQERSYILPDNLQEFDNYVIERKLGSGGFASVFLASPKGVAFQAAIKIFSPQPSLVRESGLSLAELKERFRREAGIMLRLSTGRVPGIVNARHTETWRGKPYLTMDYYPKNLSSLIGSDEELLQTGRGGYLSYDTALPIISRVLTSIHGLHNRTDPIIHRDLKPANILLDKDNRPYIGDFGLAREASRADLLSKAFETVTGTHLATQYYGAPEQRGGFKETDQRADVFSLGVIIYRILTGRLIGFHDLEPIELYVEGLGRDTASKINDLLNKATRIEVDQRLADVSTLLEIFSIEQMAVETTQASPSGPTPEDQFLTALELAYSFAPDGSLPENVRATLITKSHELGIDLIDAELLEKDFRSRLGLSEDKDDRVISATGGAALKTGEEQGIGTLTITSEPEMATVSVDGIERGTTPLTIDRVGGGKRTIRLKMNGFFPVSRIERIIPDEEAKIHVILEHQTGSINVSAKTFSDAYPARFYLDGKLMGRPPLTVEDVTAGTHTYRFEADNHDDNSGEIALNLDEEVKLDESLKPLPGIVTLRSTPSGAAIWVDGKWSKLNTDVRAKIPAGKHTITLKLDSYVDAAKEIEVLPGKVLEEQFRLIKNQGTINVVSIPDGADVWIDGKNTLKRTDCLLDLLTGEHELVLMLHGYENVKKRVLVEPEGFAEAEFRFEKGVNNLPPEPSILSETEPDGNYGTYGKGTVKENSTGLGWVAGLLKNRKVLVTSICAFSTILALVIIFVVADYNGKQDLPDITKKDDHRILDQKILDKMKPGMENHTKEQIAKVTRTYGEPLPDIVLNQIEDKYKDFLSIPPFEVLKAYFAGERQYQKLSGDKPLLYETNLNFHTAYYSHIKNGLIEGKGLTYENGCLTFHFAEFHLSIKRWKDPEFGITGYTNLVFPKGYLGTASMSTSRSREFFKYHYDNDFTMFLLYSPKGVKRYETKWGMTRLALVAIPLQLIFYDPNKVKSIDFRIEDNN